MVGESIYECMSDDRFMEDQGEVILLLNVVVVVHVGFEVVGDEP